jgi:hypothetical protein
MSFDKDSPKHKESGLPKAYVGNLSTSTALARKRHWKKMSKLSDRDPRAYEPAPGDARAKTKPSQATLAVRKMMKEQEVEISEEANTSLSAKAKKTGISLSTLKTVYKRGVAAWNSGHRPGTTPSQWGHARVNSYIRKGKGTYGGADKDLREAKDEREYGYEGDMVMSQLKGMINHAKQLHDMLEPDTDLPEWVQSKITLAYDYIQTAADYMETEMMSEAVEVRYCPKCKKNETRSQCAYGGNYWDNNAEPINEARAPGTPSVKRYTRPDGTTALKSLNKWGQRKDWRDSEGGMAKAKAHAKIEESDQINELSKDTLKSYVNKADARTMDRTIDNPVARKKAQNRTFGIEKAVKKIKEDALGGGVPANNMSSGAVADPKNKMLFNKKIKRFQDFKKR